MFDTLFGADVSPALKFFIAFVIVLALIGVTAWLVRRFGANGFGGSSARGRQPRLAVVDAAAVDAPPEARHHPARQCRASADDRRPHRRRGRAEYRPRHKRAARQGGGAGRRPRRCPFPKPPPRPVSVAEGAMWPLQPQAETNGRTTPRAAPEEPMQWTWPAHSEPQRPPRPSRASAREAGYDDEFGG